MMQRVLSLVIKLVVLSSVLAAVPGSAAPPPPAFTPASLDKPIDGYDMRPVFQLWRYWVESRKGPVTESLLAEPEMISGLQHFGRLLRFKRNNDFGHYLTGEIRAYCVPVPRAPHFAVSGSCVYVLRRAYVAFDAASYGESNPVSDWTRTKFDAGSLVQHLRASGLPASTNWWLADRSVLFLTAPSPTAVLTSNAQIVRVDSSECPNMEAAIKAVEGQPLDAGIDFPTVGIDEQFRPTVPHALTTEYSIYLRANGGPYVIEGRGGLAEKLVTPILGAVDQCEQLRNDAG